MFHLERVNPPFSFACLLFVSFPSALPPPPPPPPPHTRPIMLLDILCSGYDQVFNEYCLNVSNANRVRITVENHRDTCMLLDGDLSIYFDITEEENYFTCYPMFLDGRLEIIPILSYLKMHGCLEKYENNKAAFL